MMKKKGQIGAIVAGVGGLIVLIILLVVAGNIGMFGIDLTLDVASDNACAGDACQYNSTNNLCVNSTLGLAGCGGFTHSGNASQNTGVGISTLTGKFDNVANIAIISIILTALAALLIITKVKGN